jgi:hypothetical protein
VDCLGRVLSSGAPRRKMVESDDAFASAKKAALALPRYLLQLYPHLLMNTSVTHLRSRVQIFCDDCPLYHERLDSFSAKADIALVTCSSCANVTPY